MLDLHVLCRIISLLVIGLFLQNGHTEPTQPVTAPYFQQQPPETPYQEGVRVQQELEKQREEPVIPTEITINQYRYQMQLEKQLRSQKGQLDRLQEQLDQLKRSEQYDENE